ncbi:MAG: N-acetylmuramoyl-L-alanine amidase, partial [Clostridia bacterium]|nr:N-acetylmuramoyl-L-alanine amidase [Clostridia bacterium]
LKPRKERAAMAGDYYVLRGELHSALVECGFLSNAKEEKLLLSPEYHRKIAQALSLGLIAWQEAEKDL